MRSYVARPVTSDCFAFGGRLAERCAARSCYFALRSWQAQRCIPQLLVLLILHFAHGRRSDIAPELVKLHLADGKRSDVPPELGFADRRRSDEMPELVILHPADGKGRCAFFSRV